ncbi:MAG: protoheme IX farnesyltransferase [Gammaproteobacteria bacterium]|nr:protoheme IX farnesyltransferase [Gammaproteobacteria bacterium]MBT4607516.1 protoheme IX farnesyltransferase [Thiotrichales bacterium]MBT4329246.1 protoheme IX farnesyltransferase [Gammaproteobacteria bacterium]MBT4811580.1 protoheme IX farnesyltransferase [Thiotrichales bacterium]MBT5634347.1 protoheme IX farnesyltransferase [Gammaproteobacteria bacterium]
MAIGFKQLANIFKLRIGVTIALTAVVGLAITPGPSVPASQIWVLLLTVLLSSASAGGFNQYLERDYDGRMERTRNRPFVTGEIKAGIEWPIFLYSLLFISVSIAAYVINGMAAFYVFLGAFFYAFVYTWWLKRRTWLNIVVGGLAGSFAVLAGAATVNPTGLDTFPMIFSVVLFLWTPSHFWSLAIALREDYARGNIPMLPVVVGDHNAAWAIFGNSLLLVGASLLPLFFDLGLGVVYFLGAAVGGFYFLYKNIVLIRDTNRETAMSSFFASLIQLVLLMVAAVVDVHLV